jgi:LPXTG-motif cell wall-anchored protein
VTPVGGVETGSRATADPETQLPLAALGGLALVGGAGTLLLRRRFADAS